MHSQAQSEIISHAMQLGLDHHQAGRLPEAERHYQRVLQIDPSHPEALQLLGVIAHQVGKNDIAVQLIDKALLISPDYAEAHSNRGLVLQELKRFDEALASCDRALAIAPDYAQASYNRGNALKGLERYDEALASFDRALKIKPDFGEALGNRAFVLQGLGRHDEALAGYDRALAIRPGDADLLNNRGNALRELGRHDEALASFERALAIKPGLAEALANRALVLQDLKRYEEALASYDRALALKPAYADALYNRGVLLQELRRNEEAVASYDRSLAINPDAAGASCNRGVALHNLGRYDEALASFGHALALKPGYAEAHWNESLCRLLIGDFGRGWDKYEWRWKCSNFSSPRRNFPQPLWLGQEDIAGKTILLHAEQGLGDTIQFSRYAQAVAQKGARVVLEVQPVLKSLLSGISGPLQVLGKGEPLPDFDFHCPLLSLPLAFGTRLESIPAPIPYLSVSKGGASAWRRNLARPSTRLVGLCWKGSAQYKGDRERSVRLAQLRPLFDTPGVRFVSLQKELDAGERALTAGMGNFVHPGADFGTTAEMIGALDLVISVDTSWSHWAGAIGKPLWILLRSSPHWVWLLDRDDSPWYPSARLFRQSKNGDWDSVVEKLRLELAAWAGSCVRPQ